MGVLEVPYSLQQSNVAPNDILSSFEVENVSVDLHLDIDYPPSTRTKRKRTKSTGICYDFRDCGVDARRRGSKHQRRKQNFCDLLQMIGSDDNVQNDVWFPDQNTAFSELFMDEKKMKMWEGFMNLPDDKQKIYLESLQEVKSKAENDETQHVSEEDIKFLLIDPKIRDMLRSKHLAHEGLLRYYEEDMISCMDGWFPSVIVFNLESRFDRMLVYGLCQYMCLSWNTIKLKDSTLIEIELENDCLQTPDISLTQYLKTK